jgi:ABC-type nitrate/sulfonate/bicarbonate transport system permease component
MNSLSKQLYPELRQAPQAPWGKSLGLLFLILFGFFWFVATLGDVEHRFVSPAILPSPGELFGSVHSLLFERHLGQSILYTLARVFAGFFLAVAVGVPLGIISGSVRAVQSFLSPIVIALRNLPLAALIPLTILWFGIDEAQKVMFIFIATLPFVFSDACAAIINVPERYVDTAKTLGASNSQLIGRVLVPLAMPDIFGSLRSLFGLAFGYIMLAELINAPLGLGAMINISQRRGQTEHIFLILLIIGGLAWMIDTALGYLQQWLFPYKDAA